ncbi:hypothetical protein [Occallatibacter savannae]|uniref:hypothetical protein n=1 Tax=Occallatibacter savannae TaxID=1002691 RepID=UPI000D698741|nr:hypothetical protein [Occallatibacter savannae]
MKKLIVRFVVAALCLAFLTHATKADAQIPVSGKQAAGIFGVLIGVGVGIGVGVYFLVRAPHNVTGCASEEGGGLQLTDEQGTKHYVLQGETAAIKPGERVRISGKPGKGANKQRTFAVKKVTKDYGACSVSGAAR